MDSKRSATATSSNNLTCVVAPDASSENKEKERSTPVNNSQQINKSIKLKCDACKKTFAYEGNLKKHIRNRKVYGRCLRSQFIANIPNVALNDKTSNETKTDDVSTKSSRIRAILKGASSKPPKPQYFMCYICVKKFPTEPQLKSHMVEHADTLFPCTQCSKKFSYKSELKLHANSHKPKSTKPINAEKPFKCDICGKGFTHATNLKLHVNRHGWEYHYDTRCRQKIVYERKQSEQVAIKCELDDYVESGTIECDIKTENDLLESEVIAYNSQVYDNIKLESDFFIKTEEYDLD